MTALADRVKESTTTTGTGSLTLSGAVPQFESFNTAFGTGNPFYYVITDANGTDWEVGTGELSNATTLVRTTVHQSSNADAKISLSSGTHSVFCSAPAVFLADLASKTGKLSQFAATTSAELAGVVSDETGSGALVFATSPTLTTPNIGVATATSVNGTTIPSSKTLVVTTDKLSALAATTSAELAGVISDETGSGSLVFATSPTLTTPNIGTPSAGTLTNCTGLPVGGVSGLGTGVATALAVNTGSAGAVVVNGGALGTPSSGTVTNLTGTASININGTVGATTPNTGAFTTLSATGVAMFAAGTAAAPAITTSGDTNNGIFFPAADVTAITTAGSERMRVDASGNLGIGGAPTSKFHVKGTGTTGCELLVQNTTVSTGYGWYFRSNDAGTGEIGFSGIAEGPALRLSNSTGNAQFFGNLNLSASGARITGDFSNATQANRVAFQSSTVNGATDLYAIPNGTNTTGAFTAVNNSDPNNCSTAILGAFSADVRLYSNKNGTGSYLPLLFYTGGSERMRLDTSGNVGIGTSSPGCLLNLKTATNSITETLRLQNDNNVADNGNKITWRNAGTAFEAAYVAATRVGASVNYALTFATSADISAANATERMRIDGSGNVGIGASAPGATGYTSFLALGNNNAGIGNAGTNKIGIVTNNVERILVDNAGNVGIGTSSPSNRLHVKQSADNAATGFGARIERSSNDSILLIGYRDNTDTWQYNATYTSTGAFKPLTFHTSDTERMRIDSNGNVIVNTAAIATNATNGFLYVPTCAGTPTGTPTAYTGRAPIVVDTTNNKLYFYSGGQWRDAGP